MTEEKTKVCNGCGLTLPVSAYSKSNGAKYPRSKCKACERALDQVRKRLKLENAPPAEDYRCPICERSYEQIKGRGGMRSGAWCCDHDHVSGKFRAWLCHDCNKGLGFLGDDPARCQRAVDYLGGNKK